MHPVSGLNDEMVAAGRQDLDAFGWGEIGGIGVLAAGGEDGLPDVAAILGGRVLTE